MEYYGQQEMPAALTLSQFSRYVAQAISRQPVLLGAWVVAEISDMSSSGGHCYMMLIEKDAAGFTVARMRATIWANRFAYLRDKFYRATGQQLANGMKVMLYGGANYHSNYGLSFNIGEIDPSYTMGDLERLRREILVQLQKEGIIDQNRRLGIIEPPLKVAVISSEKAAGYGDFMNQLQHNPLGVEFYTLLFPAIVQGDKTASSVIKALDMVETTDSLVKWDCVVIIRGGGGTTDMNGFDNLELARRVAAFPLPVVVGIGHERDRCVLDEIACIRCKTPTAVASWLIDSVGMQWQRAIDLVTHVANYAAERLKGEQIRLQGLETMTPAAVGAQINNAKLRLHRVSAQLPLIAQGAVSKEKVRLEGVSTMIKVSSRAIIDREDNNIATFLSNLRNAAGLCLEKEMTSLVNLEKLIDVLNPAHTLKRGYSITRVDGKSIMSPRDVAEGDLMETLTAHGCIYSKVQTP